MYALLIFIFVDQYFFYLGISIFCKMYLLRLALDVLIKMRRAIGAKAGDSGLGYV